MRALELTIKVYRVTPNFPREELYGPTSSASELDYRFLLARDLEFLERHRYDGLRKKLEELRRMLTALILRVDNERQLAKC